MEAQKHIIPLAALTEAPMLPKALDEKAKSDFAEDMARAAGTRDLNNPGVLQAFIAEQIQLRRAVVQALHPDSTFSHEFAHKLELHFPGLPHEIAMQASQSILINQRDTQASLTPLLGDQHFLQEVVAIQKKGLPQEIEQPVMSDVQTQKLSASLVYKAGEAKPEPAVHILATADGHRIWHDKLAIAYRPGGPLESLLTGELTKHAPRVESAAVAQAARVFMARRHARARAVANALQPEGAVVQAAIAESERVRQQNASVAEPQVSWSNRVIPAKTAESARTDIGTPLAF